MVSIARIIKIQSVTAQATKAANNSTLTACFAFRILRENATTINMNIVVILLFLC